MIEQNKPEYISYANYRNIDFAMLTRAYNSPDDFIGYHNTLNFDAPIGYLNLTGDKLLYYPELAKALRNIPEYPILKKSYKVPETLLKKTGIEFLIEFTEFAKQCQQEFEQERGSLSAKVNNYIQMFGIEKTTVIINKLIYSEGGSIVGLEINGVKFELSGQYYYAARERNPAECINFDYLIQDEKEKDYKRYRIIEDCIPNSPYLAIRYRKFRQAGHLVWYNLNTRQRVSLKEINAFKRNKA